MACSEEQMQLQKAKTKPWTILPDLHGAAEWPAAAVIFNKLMGGSHNRTSGPL